jgi:nitrogen PTS system EIIA component
MLCHYLSPQTIICPTQGSSKHEIIESLTDALIDKHHLRHGKKILQAILSREKVGSTFLPIGVAIPHARCKDVDEIKMVMGILPEGLIETFEGTDYPIHLICLFVSPTAEQNFGRHLKLLARIAAVFRNVHIVKELAAASNPGIAFPLLQRFEREAEDLQAEARQNETHDPS